MKIIEVGKKVNNKDVINIKLGSSLCLIEEDNYCDSIKNNIIKIIDLFKQNTQEISEDGEVDFYIVIEKYNKSLKYVKCFYDRNIITDILLLDNELVVMFDFSTRQLIKGPAKEEYFNSIRKNYSKPFYGENYPSDYPDSSVFKVLPGVLGLMELDVALKALIIDDILFTTGYIGDGVSRFSDLTKQRYCDIIPKLDLGISRVCITYGNRVDYFTRFSNSTFGRDYFGSGLRTLSTTLPYAIESIVEDKVCLFVGNDIFPSLHPVLCRELINLYNKYSKGRGQIITLWYYGDFYDDILPSNTLKMLSKEPVTLI